jgi:isochorismate synthase
VEQTNIWWTAAAVPGVAHGFDGEALLDFAPYPYAYWSTPAGDICVGLGTVAMVKGSGVNRLAAVRNAAAQYKLRSVDAEARLGSLVAAAGDAAAAAASDLAAIGPVWMGGFGFTGAEPEAGGPWAAFPPAFFFLPSILYRRIEGNWHVVVTSKSESPVLPDALRAAKDHLIVVAGRKASAGNLRSNRQWTGQALDSSDAAAGSELERGYDGVPPIGCFLADIEPAPETLAAAAVGALKGADGAAENRRGLSGGPPTIGKVVVAVRARLAGAEQIPAVELLARMRAAEPDAFGFLMSLAPASAMVGVSPERLVAVSRDTVRSVALAGSAPRDADPAAAAAAGAAILESDKDLREHRVVVDAIAHALANHTGVVPGSVEHAAQPRLRQLGRIQHLETPITARLQSSQHVLHVAASLHPTPALGGEPRAAALELLQALEVHERGWYGGGVGWFDAQGEGELAVVLRSVLLANQAAFAYAGAGIVEGSQPAAEAREIRMKLESIVRSVGASVQASVD